METLTERLGGATENKGDNEEIMLLNKVNQTRKAVAQIDCKYNLFLMNSVWQVAEAQFHQYPISTHVTPKEGGMIISSTLHFWLESLTVGRIEGSESTSS